MIDGAHHISCGCEFGVSFLGSGLPAEAFRRPPGFENGFRRSGRRCDKAARNYSGKVHSGQDIRDQDGGDGVFGFEKVSGTGIGTAQLQSLSEIQRCVDPALKGVYTVSRTVQHRWGVYGYDGEQSSVWAAEGGRRKDKGEDSVRTGIYGQHRCGE